MNYLYDFPKNAAYGKVLPKNKIYKYSSPSYRIKDQFSREIDKFIWSYKLSPDTINLPAKGDVEEIQIFTVIPKSGEFDINLLSIIDKAVPSPIIFVINYDDRTCYAAAHKRQSEADKNKWVIGRYFKTDWISNDADEKSLPVVLDLEKLYYALLNSIIAVNVRKNESITDYVSRAEMLNLKQHEAEMLETRMNREKQFNRKVEMNSELKRIKDEIITLKE
ncbi:MAG: DUF4391 domain-containing protein [Spirochaetes bacterium]|nr:DUF4391 domain-containing protein [Spirochaetota bacterium]